MQAFYSGFVCLYSVFSVLCAVLGTISVIFDTSTHNDVFLFAISYFVFVFPCFSYCFTPFLIPASSRIIIYRSAYLIAFSSAEMFFYAVQDTLSYPQTAISFIFLTLCKMVTFPKTHTLKTIANTAFGHKTR